MALELEDFGNLEVEKIERICYKIYSCDIGDSFLKMFVISNLLLLILFLVSNNLLYFLM